MSVLITIAVLVFLGLWATAVYGRMLRLRRAVRFRWREVGAARTRRQNLAAGDVTASDASDLADADHALEQARLHYNLIATKYNAAITGVPGSIVASLAGFKPAELLSPEEAAGTTTGASS
jgi:hypothetical protein